MSKAERDARYRAKHKVEIARRQHERYLRDPTPWQRGNQRRAERDRREGELIRELFGDEDALTDEQILNVEDDQTLDERELLFDDDEIDEAE